MNFPAELLRPGHTAFLNGLHGDGWLEKGEVVRHPERLDELAQVQAAQIAGQFAEVTLLVGASQCGAVVAAFVARHLSLPVAFASINHVENAESGVTLHRMHRPVAGQRVVVVDDLISTGRDAAALCQGLQDLGHQVVGISVWTVRETAKLPDVPIHALWAAPFQTYPVNDCPLCREQKPLVWQNLRE